MKLCDPTMAHFKKAALPLNLSTEIDILEKLSTHIEELKSLHPKEIEFAKTATQFQHDCLHICSGFRSVYEKTINKTLPKNDMNKHIQSYHDNLGKMKSCLEHIIKKSVGQPAIEKAVALFLDGKNFGIIKSTLRKFKGDENVLQRFFANYDPSAKPVIIISTIPAGGISVSEQNKTSEPKANDNHIAIVKHKPGENIHPATKFNRNTAYKHGTSVDTSSRKRNDGADRQPDEQYISLLESHIEQQKTDIEKMDIENKQLKETNRTLEEQLNRLETAQVKGGSKQQGKPYDGNRDKELVQSSRGSHMMGQGVGSKQQGKPYDGNRDKELQQLREENSKQKDIIGDLKYKNKDLAEKLEKVNGSKPQLKQKTEVSREKELQQLQDDKSKQNEIIQLLKIQLKDLSDKLSEEYSKKMAGDESNVENVSIKTRPMNVAEEYRLMSSEEWLDAKTCMDQKYNMDNNMKIETNILQFLATIIKEAEMESKSTHETFWKNVNANVKLPSHLRNTIGDHLRVASEEIDLTEQYNILSTKMIESKTGKQFKDSLKWGPMQKYINAALKLSWKMAIQRPPMTFMWRGEGKKMDGKLFEPQWGSGDPKKKDVQFIVYPPLFHGDKILEKGKVFI